MCGKITTSFRRMVQGFLITIPPSRLRRATSLYTREAYLIRTKSPLSDENQCFLFRQSHMFSNRMAYFARKLSRQATYGVRVCDKVRFDFKMSQTPSVPQEGGFLIALLLTKNQCRIGVLTVCHFTYGLPQTQTPLCKGSSQHS